MIASVALLLAVAQTRQPLFGGTGSYTRKVTTRSQMAQRYFDQGLNFLFAFNHDEAIRAFQEAARQDPECAMAYWGVSFANGPHINNPFVDEAHSKAAIQAARRALQLSSKGTRQEKALILALQKRYANPQPADRRSLDRAFADAMRAVWRAHPNDPDVGTFYAESMMNLRPWDLWKANGQPQPGTTEIVRTLDRVLKMRPNQPLANHLYIHAVEASPRPQDAIPASDRLRFLQPGMGHNVHMPSHIDVRVGRWQEAIASNERAMVADEAYRKVRPRVGFYRLYMAHNSHMLAFSAMMTGERGKAVRAIDRLIGDIPADWLKQNAMFVDGFMYMPIEVRKRFGMWDQVLSMPDPGELFPMSRTMRHGARAIAYAAKGMVDEARMEQALFEAERTKVPPSTFFGNNSATNLMEVASRLQSGEILIAEGKTGEALRELSMAVKAEDKLRYSEPPDWILPTRHTLGAYLIKLGRNEEAIKVYQKDLASWPNNGWSLYGLATAQANIGHRDAANTRRRFEAVWAKADTKITSSCMCLPGEK